MSARVNSAPPCSMSREFFGVILEREADLAVIVVGIFNGDAVVCGKTVVGFEEPPDGLNGWGHEDFS